MDSHEAVGVTDPVKLFHHPFLEMQELLPILVGVKYPHLPDTLVYDMVQGSGELDSQSSGHGLIPFPPEVWERSKNRAKSNYQYALLDNNLITGQQRNSGSEVAMLIIKALEGEELQG
jgi:hypothetical protein